MHDYLSNPASGDMHVICYRCDSLNLSGGDLRYMKDRYFPVDMGRYKDLKQKCEANQHKRDMGDKCGENDDRYYLEGVGGGGVSLPSCEDCMKADPFKDCEICQFNDLVGRAEK